MLASSSDVILTRFKIICRFIVRRLPLRRTVESIRCASTATVVLLLLSNAGYARGTVSGIVSDPSGAAVANARVTLRDASGTIVSETRTLSDGRFELAGASDGTYRVVVEAQGFAQSQQVSVSIKNGEASPLKIQLDVAAVSDQIVVTASRTERPLSELPASVSVISGAQLLIEDQSQVSESLRSVPGLIVAQTGGRGGFTSVFVRGGESDYNKVLIDGVPVNAPGGAFDFSALTTENLSRIEVTRGPASSLFGSDAMTSVIQLFTKRGTTTVPEFEFSGEGGSFDFHRETARLSGLVGKFDYSGSFGFQSSDGRFRNSDFINRSLSGNFGYQLSSTMQLRATSRWNDNTLGVPGPTAVLFADPDQRQKHRDIAVSGVFEWRTRPNWFQTARFIYSEFNTHSFDPVAQDLSTAGTPPLPPGAFGDDFAFTFRDHEKKIGAQYQTILAAGKYNVITAGLDFERESAVFTDDFSRVSPDRDNLGIYVQDQFAWRERFFATAGVRVERNSGSVPADLRSTLEGLGSIVPTGDVGFGVSANPRIAASFLLRNHHEHDVIGATRIKASFGTGIKEPSLNEAFSPSPFFLGNPKLDPERAISYEVGIGQEFFGRRASIEATYFDNRFRDMIAFESDPVTFGPIMLPNGQLTNFVNLERSRARGLELIAAARPFSRFQISGSYTFVDSELQRAAPGSTQEEGLPLLRRPRHSGTVRAGWIGSRFDVTVEGLFVGERRDLDPVTFSRFDVLGLPIFSDSYARVNLSGQYRVTRMVTAFARIENLLNEEYQEILGFPSYRLNFTAGLRLRFGGGK